MYKHLNRTFSVLLTTQSAFNPTFIQNCILQSQRTLSRSHIMAHLEWLVNLTCMSLRGSCTWKKRLQAQGEQEGLNKEPSRDEATVSTPPLCHPVKTTESLSYIIPLTQNVLHLCRTASSSYFKHVAEMTTLSGGHLRQVLQEDRITTASHSVLPGNCVHILGKKSGLFKVGVSIQQSCHLACPRFSWICVKAKPRSDSTAQGHYSGILADYRKT